MQYWYHKYMTDFYVWQQRIALAYLTAEHYQVEEIEEVRK